MYINLILPFIKKKKKIVINTKWWCKSYVFTDNTLWTLCLYRDVYWLNKKYTCWMDTNQQQDSKCSFSFLLKVFMLSINLMEASRLFRTFPPWKRTRDLGWGLNLGCLDGITISSMVVSVVTEVEKIVMR